MPFTPAHPAIILPLLKLGSRQLSATALILGAVAPDFEYFLKMDVNSVHSHTLTGLFYFDVPLTVVLAFVFHLVVKKNLIQNLPVFFQMRFHPFISFDFKAYFRDRYGVFLVSALIGSASHLFWDGFTHLDGFFVQNMPYVYKDRVFPFQGARYPLWYALQHISTFAGLTIILLAMIFMKPHPVHVVKPRWKYWIIIALLTMLIVLIRFNFNVQSIPIGRFVVSTITACCVAFIAAGCMRIRNTSIPLAKENG